MKRRLMNKTDLGNNDLVMNVDANLLNVVNILVSGETVPAKIPSYQNVDDP